MDCKKIGIVACGLAAVGAMTLAPQSAKAQDSMMGDGTMMATTSMDQPMMVSGTVLRYYVDRAGYVTAMDVQTAQGVQFVRFSPSLGQRLYSTYPVGGQVTAYVTSNTRRGGTYYDVVSMGEKMPAPEAMTMKLTDVDLLDSPAYIMTGAKMITVRGTLSDVITNDQGEVVGLVINGAEKQVMKATGKKMIAGRTMMVTADGQMMPVMFKGGKTMVKMADGKTTELMMADGKYVIPDAMAGAQMKMVMSDGRQMNMDTVDGKLMVMDANGQMMPVAKNGRMMMPGMMPEAMAGSMVQSAATGTLVRVPREFRHARSGQNGTSRITPLFKGSEVEVTGYPEAPRYGVVSLYANRITANAIVINSRAVGALGMPRLDTKNQRALFNNLDIGGSSQSAEEARAAKMGYNTYGTSNTMGNQPMMTNDGMTN